MTGEFNEIVYVLVNEAMPGYVKVGRTGDLTNRMRQLDTTGVPLPFECFYAKRVRDAVFVEGRLLAAFGDHRVRRNREFLSIAPEKVKAALQMAEGEEVTVNEENVVESQDDIDALARAKSRKRNFTFSMIGLEPGTVLVHTHDSNTTCAVHDDRYVIFEDEVMSLSRSAGIVVQRQGLSPQVAGTAYWTYNGKRLWEIREDMAGELQEELAEA